MSHPRRIVLTLLIVPTLMSASRAAADDDSLTADLTALYERVRPAVVRITAEGAYGSGFVIDDGATVATAWHVVSGADSIWLQTTSGEEVQATLLDWDKEADVALLTLDEPLDVEPLQLSDAVPVVGDTLFAIGHPLIGPQQLKDRHEGLLEWSFTAGMVSLVGEHQIQTTVELHPGNSGGPVFDEEGRVVGIAVERAGLFGLARKIDVVAELLAVEDREPKRRPLDVSPFVSLRLGASWFPTAGENRVTYGGVGGEVGVILGHKLLLGARVQHVWLASDEERDAGRLGRHLDTSFIIGPSLTLARHKKAPFRLRLQPYFSAGVGVASSGLRSETFQFADPACDPTLEPCDYVQEESTAWDRSTYPMLGGGVRLDMSNFFLDLGTTFSPVDPQGTFGVGLTFGVRFGKF